MKKILLSGLFLGLAVISCTTEKKMSEQSVAKRVAHDYLTIDEAISALKVHDAAAPLAANPGVSPKLPASFSPPYRSVEPIKLFDNLYFVGTTTVGAFIVNSGNGLVMLDTGIGDTDVAMMVEDMKKLGLDPSRIKLILISHEHFDHYGGVQYLKKNVCPNAKVAMSLTGWNMLQTVPSEWAYIGTRPQSAVWPTQVEARLYKSSIEYFKAFAQAAKCDVGLVFHSQESDFAKLRIRKSGEPNPLVIGQDKFDTVFLQKFRDRYQKILESGDISPYKPL